MKIGMLNRRVALERYASTRTPSGGQTDPAWVPVATVWANVRYLNGSETSKSDFPVGSARASIRIRFRDDIDPTCRAVYTRGAKTTYFDIKAVLPDQVGREYVDLAVEEGVNNG